MILIVPQEMAPDVESLLQRLGSQHELVRWNPQEPLPEGDSPILLDLRGETPELGDLLAERPSPILVIAEPNCDRVSELPRGNSWTLIGPDWPLDAQAALVEAKIAAWEAQASAAFQATEEHRHTISDADTKLEDQSIELLVRNSELNRLEAFKKGVLNRLGDAERGFIAEILRHVTEMEKVEDLPGSLKNIHNNLHHTALKIQHIFRSFDHWERIDRALEGRSILVATSDEKLRKLVVRAFGDSGANIEGVASAAEGLEVVKDRFVDLLYVSWDNAELIGQAHEARPDVKTVLLTDELLFENVGSKMLDLALQNVLILSRAGLDEDDEDPLFLGELSATAVKLLSEDIFGIEKYLAWGTKIHEVLVTNSDQRFEILDQIQQFTPKAGLRRSMGQNLETMADELLMNAIWDAPVDETGHHKYASLSRRKSIQLLPHECPVLRYGADSRQVGISVTDPFGGLERDHAYRYLVKCFSRKSDQIDSKRGGAGLGLYTAFLAVSTFVINVAPGFRTEVIGLLDNRLSRRKLSGRSRSYHYFLSEGPPRGR